MTGFVELSACHASRVAGWRFLHSVGITMPDVPRAILSFVEYGVARPYSRRTDSRHGVGIVRYRSLLIAGVAVAISVAAYAEAPRTFKLAQAPNASLLKGAGLKEAERLVPPALQKQLDEILATKDYLALTKALLQAPPIERFGWLMSSLYAGKTAFLGYPLLRELSGLAQLQTPLGQTARTAVGVVALYVYQLHVIDGAMCEDVSAPGPHLARYLAAFQPLFLSLKAKPFTEKLNVIKLALDNERQTRALRKGDDFLCRGGIAEFQASIEQHGPGVTVGELAAKYGEKSKSGVGTDIRLPPPAKKFEPRFLPPEKYGPRQHELRMGMVDRLVELLK